MAGVEPASEEKTIQTATYVVCLSELFLPEPTDRFWGEPPRMPRLRRDSPDGAGCAVRLSCQSRRLFGNRQAGPRETGYLIT